MCTRNSNLAHGFASKDSAIYKRLALAAADTATPRVQCRQVNRIAAAKPARRLPSRATNPALKSHREIRELSDSDLAAALYRCRDGSYPEPEADSEPEESEPEPFERPRTRALARHLEIFYAGLVSDLSEPSPGCRGQSLEVPANPKLAAALSYNRKRARWRPRT